MKMNGLKVGFLGFGEVASTLAEGLLKNDVEIYACLEGRSGRSKDLARSLNVGLCKDNQDLIESSKIILSAVTPSQAVKAAQNVSKARGVFVDLNNISPSTVREVLGQIQNGKTVDAAIIGSVRRNGLKVKIIASGPSANEFAILNDYGMNIEVIGFEPGQASAIKLLRSAYTKGVAALLLESLYAAYSMGIDEQALKYISETEGPEFMESAISRMISSAYHARRKCEEMQEVKNMISLETEPIMTQASEQFFQELHKNLPDLNKRPKTLQELFILIKKSQER